MQLTTLTFLASTVAAVSAAALTPEPEPELKKFSLTPVREDTPIHKALLRASKDDELFLDGGDHNSHQQMYTNSAKYKDDGSYSVSLYVGNPSQDGRKLCIPFQAEVTDEPTPVSCKYTEQ
ncbi:uncharacterized protein C8A04DRAFT_24337 [Dichotomopilus funicola]|uniref:Uncharacterized protein n=1 Tax=Dichotomopilus funicola TaxID=1934379 RepID=A0AAN6VAD4_9PEZI|nr:hypothetical protein C8A04DRAFT_24337 [Dichotomopilus funicola]